MKLLNTWTLPVAVSLLLHTGLLVLVIYKFPATSPATNQSQAITVELSRADSTPANKPRLHTVSPKVFKKPVQDDDKNRTPFVLNPAAEVALTAPTQPVEMSADRQPANLAAESQQSRSGIQPISKLTRLPSFLQKIEPVYPRSEQRAGSQAYVLAEVTIDEKGIVQGVKIIKSAGVAFDNAVIEALRKSIFVPGYIGQEAVAVRVLVPIRFNLR
jgi:TonB family protein